MAAARIQRWALLLAAYKYEAIYKEGKINGNADGLSRLPVSECEIEDIPIPGETILLIDHLDITPVQAEQIGKWIQQDPTLR
jgi:hypothetical protein